MGGLHLQKPSRERLLGVSDFMKSLDLGALHAGHCTDLASKVALARVAPLVHPGTVLVVTGEPVSERTRSTPNFTILAAGKLLDEAASGKVKE